MIHFHQEEPWLVCLLHAIVLVGVIAVTAAAPRPRTADRDIQANVNPRVLNSAAATTADKNILQAKNLAKAIKQDDPRSVIAQFLFAAPAAVAISGLIALFN